MSGFHTDQQFKRARSEIAFAFDRAEFFRAHMTAAGLEPHDIMKPADLAKIPPTQKVHYRKNFPAGVLARGRTLDEPGLFRIQSSGTEGERLITVIDRITVAERWSRALRANPALAFLPTIKDMRTASYAAPNCSDVECSNPNSTMQDRTLPDRTLILPVYHDLLTTPESMRDSAAREIVEYQPHLMYIDATHLAFLVRHMRAKGLPPPPVGAIVASYTLVTKVARRQISEFFGPKVPFAEVVAMSEFGYMVMECPKGRLHLCTAPFYMEIVTPDGREAQPGERGELLVTSLGDQLSPHIRYRTGDLYRAESGKCACGSAYPVVRVEGRMTHMLRRRGEIVATPRDIDDIVGPAPFLDLYQMDQLAEDRFVFKCISNERFDDALARDLERRLLEQLGDGARLTFERTQYIPAERSGKFVPCKSTWGAKQLERGRAS